MTIHGTTKTWDRLIQCEQIRGRICERENGGTVGAHRQNEMQRDCHREEKVNGIDNLESNKMLT